jgi:hypothetical protein
MVSWGDAPGWDGMGPLARKTWSRWPARIRPHHARFGLFAHLPRQRRTAIRGQMKEKQNVKLGLGVPGYERIVL